MPNLPDQCCRECRERALPGTLYCAAHTKKPGASPVIPPVSKKQKPSWSKWYHRAQWKNLRITILHRDPICKKCNRYPSTVVDHIKPHKGVWALFCDPKNLQGMCQPCHDEKTATEDGGFGNEQQPANTPAPTGEKEGKLFTGTSVGDAALDEALSKED